MKTSLIATGVVALLSLAAASAHAAPFTGGFSFAGSGLDASGAITLGATNLETGGSGSFDNEVYATVTGSTGTLMGLSASPKTESVSDFLEFASPSQAPAYASITGNGNIYRFDLTSLSEIGYNAGGLHGATYYGTGVLRDTTGTLDNTPASFTISFSGANGYSGSLSPTATPEPASLSVLGVSLLGLLARRRRSA